MPRIADANVIEVLGSHGVLWTPLDDPSGDLALEFRGMVRPRIAVVVDGNFVNSGVRGGFLMDGGHCVPLVREGTGWGAVTPLPRVRATLVVEAGSLGSALTRWLRQEQLSVELKTAAPLSPGLMAAPWGVISFDPLKHCGVVVEVVDREGRPVVGAKVAPAPKAVYANQRPTTRAQTDEQGLACVANDYFARSLGMGYMREDVLEDDAFVVEAPLEMGGSCVAVGSGRLNRRRQVTRVSLPLPKVTLSRSLGRVVSEDGHPAAGAEVRARSLTLASGCRTIVGEQVLSAPDGTFSLPPLAAGMLTLEVAHPFYELGRFELKVGSAKRDLILRRPGG